MVPARMPRMPGAQDTMMLVIGAQDEIVGITRFIKYLFLACQNGTLRDPPDIEWRGHYYGPYWDGFNGAVDSLVGQKLISTAEITNDVGRTTKYSITVKGRKHYRKLLGELGEGEIADLDAVIRSHRRKPLVVFLKFIYENYPEYTKRSLIADKILP